jgi:DNA uptake protein ComE-like DNA-binding protein
MNEILQLTEKLADFPYPSSMVMIKNEITGRAFFPGGNGTFNNDTNLNDKDIMILEQDFDCLKNYNKSFKLQLEKIETNPTWKNILSFLKELNINSDRCFFYKCYTWRTQ